MRKGEGGSEEEIKEWGREREGVRRKLRSEEGRGRG